MARNLGKTDSPITILPSIAFDLQTVQPMPRLQLPVRVRIDATPTQIGHDLFRVYVALNKLDLLLSGNGLTPDDDLAPTNGVCTLTFKPNEALGRQSGLCGSPP